MAITDWPRSRVEQLQTWWDKGLSAGVIASKFLDDEFPVTRSAVMGKVYRLNLVHRSPLILYSRRGSRQVMKASLAPQRKPKETKPLGRPSGPAAPKPKPVIVFGPRVNGVGELTGCCWIEGDPRIAGWFYCNAAVTRGCYCEGHAAICTRPTPEVMVRVASKRSRFGHFLHASP